MSRWSDVVQNNIEKGTEVYSQWTIGRVCIDNSIHDFVIIVQKNARSMRHNCASMPYVLSSLDVVERVEALLAW